MKKLYISPNILIVKVKTESLLVSYSNSEAASDAVALGREDSFWGDDEEDNEGEDAW